MSVQCTYTGTVSVQCTYTDTVSVQCTYTDTVSVQFTYTDTVSVHSYTDTDTVLDTDMYYHICELRSDQCGGGGKQRWWTVNCIYNTVQYNTVQYNTIQYNIVQYSTIQYNTVQYNVNYSKLY